MRIIDPSYEITFHAPEGYGTLEQFIEAVARTCYKSEDKITEDSAPKFISSVLMKRGHTAMIEHCVATVRFVADRGFTHELVRHRLSSFAQESTRYCNYNKGKFGSGITVIEYPWKNPFSSEIHKRAVEAAEGFYKELIENGEPPQLARAVLPISLKAEIVMTANLREWMTVFGLRAASAAHPIMRSLAEGVLTDFAKRVPSVFHAQYTGMFKDVGTEDL